jgi:hypothetical protein
VPHPVYLHVGPPKTGTTYLQQLLWLNRDNLLKQGILYPADRWGHQYHAAADLVDGGAIGLEPEVTSGRWKDLVALIGAHEGPVVVSHELFSGASPANIEQLVSDLADRELHVVFTARNARALRESWFQEGLKNGRTWTLSKFLHTTVKEGPTTEMTVGRSGRAINSWGAVVPPERFHVVTLPPPGAPRTLLFERFCEVIGFDPTDAVLETTRVNESIGVVEAELLHRLNVREDEGWTPQAQLVIKHRLVPRFLAQRPGQRKIRIQDPAVLESLVEQTRALTRAISERGFHVVGDLAELEAAQAAMSTDPEGAEVSEAELLETALDSIRWFAIRTAELEAEKKKLREQVRAAVEARRELRQRLRAVKRAGRASGAAPATGAGSAAARPAWRRAAVGVARRTHLLGPARSVRDRLTGRNG